MSSRAMGRVATQMPVAATNAIKQKRGRISRGVHGFRAIHQALEQPAAQDGPGDSWDGSGGNRDQALPQKTHPKIGRRDAESHSHAHFMGAPGNRVGNDAIDADGGKQQWPG